MTASLPARVLIVDVVLAVIVAALVYLAPPFPGDRVAAAGLGVLVGIELRQAWREWRDTRFDRTHQQEMTP